MRAHAPVDFIARGILFLLIILGSPLAAQTGTALVRHAPVINGGTVDGSIQVLTGENITFNSGAALTGDLLVPGTPTIRLNSNSHYAALLTGSGKATPAGYTITLNSSSSLRNIVQHTDAVGLPAMSLPLPPTGTRSVSLNNSNQNPGDFATIRNLTLNSNAGLVAVPAGTYGSFTANSNSGFSLGVAGAITPSGYYFQKLTLNSNTSLQIVGPVVVTLNGSLTISSGGNGAVGAAVHPEWLKLRIAGGSLSLNSNATVYASVEASDGTVILNSNARLTGAVASDRLILNSNSRLTLLAPAAANQPPTVALTAPANGSVYDTPAVIQLAATANDPDGTIARVEFYRGAIFLGAAITPTGSASTFTFTLSSLLPGTYELTARAYDNDGASTVSATRVVTVQTGLPFFADYESAEGYSLGPLAGQGGWTTTGAVAITDNASSSGTQSVLLAANQPPAEVAHAFPAYTGQSVVFVDFFIRPAADNTPTTAGVAKTEVARVAFVHSGGQGELHVLNGDGFGDGAWQATGFKVALTANDQAAAWLRLTMREDFTTKRWDLYANGRLIAFDLKFTDNTQGIFAQFSVIGHPSVASGFDDFYAGFDNPLFADADHDGMDDAWEISNGLNPAANDRNGDRDGDGLRNIEEFAFGTRANAVDSDNDGLTDAWERQYFNPTGGDPGSDSDGDGLTNLQEYQLGRNPAKGAVSDTNGAVNLRVYFPAS